MNEQQDLLSLMPDDLGPLADLNSIIPAVVDAVAAPPAAPQALPVQEAVPAAPAAPTIPVESAALPDIPQPFKLHTRLAAGKDAGHVDRLHGDFQSSLSRMLQDAPPEILSEIEINSGFRSNERQRELFDEALKKYGSFDAARKWVAPPGGTKHNHGQAADLGFKSDRARAWAHANAEKYGLHFPMGHEPWHIEPKWARRMSDAQVPTRVTDVIRDAARETGADADFLKGLAGAESSFRPDLRAKTSSASGLFQFTDATWKDNVTRYGKLYGVQNSSPFDPRASALMAGRHAKDNYDALESALGRKPNYADQYATWVLGRSGGPKFLQAMAMNPNAPAWLAAGSDQVAANRPLFYHKDGRARTNTELYALFEAKITPQNVTPDLTARSDPRAPINVHDVWAPPPVPLDSSYTDAAREAKRMAFREERMGFWSGLGQSLTTTELTARGVRALTQKGYLPDANYIGSEDQKVDLTFLTEGLPEHYLPRFNEAVSRDHMADIARNAHAENKLLMQLDGAGWKGTAAQVAAAFLDPASIGVGVLTGGLGYEAAAAYRLGQIGSRLVGGLSGAAANVAVEAGIDSLAGQPSEVSHLALAAAMGFGFGAAFGPIGRNVATRREALELEVQAQRLMRDPTGDNVVPFPGSAGAAANPMAMPEVLSEPVFRAVQQESVPASAGSATAALRISEGGKAAVSNNPITRMLGGLLGVDMIGKAGLGVNPISADQEMARYFRAKQYDWRSIATPAYHEWAKEQGHNWLMRSIGRGWKEFNEDVVRYVRSRDPQVAAQTHAAVRRAGDHFRKMMAEMADDQRNPWKKKNGKTGGSVAGAEELMPDANYVMRVWSVSKLNSAIERFGYDGVLRTVAASIKNMRPDIEDDLAEKFANAILRSRYTRTMGYDERLDKAFGNADTSILADMLRNEFQWSEDDIRRILDRLRHTEPNMAPHLKHRIQLDESFRLKDVNGYGTGELGIEDLLENHADLLMGYYSRKVSGRVSLAQQRFVNPINGDVVVDGIKSDSDFEEIIRRAQQWYQENGVDGAEAKKELDGLRWMYDRIKGTPDEAQLTGWADWLRVAKNYNFARMMGQIGFAQMMDVGRIVGTLGVKSFTQQMRGFKRIMDMDGRSILRHGMDHELEAMFGSGTDRLRGFVAMVWDEAGQVKSATRGRAVDKANAASEAMANVTAEVSGMHYVNSWLQLMVGRAAAQKFANMASGRISRTDLRQLRFLGLDDDMLNRVLAEVRTNFSHEDGALFGRRVSKMNLENWSDTEARSAFESALFRWSRHTVQENDIGSLHRMMSHPIAQTLMQFRSYTMTAWENQLLHGIANPDGRTAAQFSASMLSGALVYAVQAQLQAVGRSDADEFLEKKFAPGAFGAAVFQRAGFSSLLPMIVDTASVFTPAGPVFDARPSGQATDFIFGNPFFSLIDDVKKTTSAVMSSIGTGRELSQGELRQMSRTMFLQNTMPIIQGYSLLISDQPERRR